METIRNLECELNKLLDFGILSYLIICGPNVSKPQRSILIEFSESLLNQQDSCGSSNSLQIALSVIFNHLVQHPSFSSLFAAIPPTRTHIYFKADKSFRLGSFTPRVNFKLSSIRDLHYIYISPSAEDTMELSDCDTTHFSGQPLSNPNSAYDENLSDKMWFACSNVIVGC